ncbi:hypothetical protein CsatB_021286 [Cannabis sativa]
MEVVEAGHETCHSISAFVRMLIEELDSDKDLVSFFKGKEPIVEGLEKLKEALIATLLLNEFDKDQIEDKNKMKCLDEFKEAVYDADDLVYKINTQANLLLLQKKELEENSLISTIIKNKVLKKLTPTKFTTAFNKAIVDDIDEITERLKKHLLVISNGRNSCCNYVGTNFGEESLVHVQESVIYGREEDKKAICNQLLQSDHDEKLSVIPIVGKSGIGKTTLADLVYNDGRVNERFDVKAWIVMGENKSIDAETVMKTIIQKLITSEKCQCEKQYEVQNKLKKVLSTKKFLLVIDGFAMNKGDDMWKILKSCFESGLHGSKIIVTTRDNDVAFHTKSTKSVVHNLKGISYEDGKRLFATHSCIDDAAVLTGHGENIVQKCEGHPLAIKSLACLLCGEENENIWRSIHDNSIWELSRHGGGTISVVHPALWLCYYYLPSHLKLCFAYFALFPKGFECEKQRIISLWMAEGLLPSNNEEKRMEDFGEEYLNDLIAKSFLQPTSKDDYGLAFFTLHDLMHDLASFVCGEFCFSMDDPNLFDGPRKIRHLSYSKGCQDDWNFAGLSKIKGLRTLLAFPISSNSHVTRSYSNNNKKKTLMPVDYLISSLPSPGTYLRVLSLSEYYITKLPDSMGDLKYLRYLDLSHTEIEVLPDTVCNLYNLQTLLLDGCTRLTTLPIRIGKLAKLRHLHTPPYLQEMPLQLGEMTTLQTLSEFVVGKNAESGVKLLEKLRDLHGTLVISRLENVKVEDVKKAKIEKKKFVSELVLKWGFGHAVDDEDSQQQTKEKQVFEALKPHTEQLKKLTIFHYKGTTFPSWVGDKLFRKLSKIELYGCEKCISLPPLGQLPSLQHLLIHGFHSLERINPEFFARGEEEEEPFKCLKTLLIKQMANLKECLFIKGILEGKVFPQLEELELRHCPKLEVSLPDDLPQIEEDCILPKWFTNNYMIKVSIERVVR